MRDRARRRRTHRDARRVGRVEAAETHGDRAGVDPENPHCAHATVELVRISMLLLAAGRGARFGGEVPKAFLPLRGRTLIERSLARLAQLASADVREIVLTVHPDDRATLLAPLLPRLRALGLTTVVDGGETRQDSMQRALAACTQAAELILVHDAARPFFPIAAAREALCHAAGGGGALLAIPAPDTLKRVDGLVVQATLSRDGVWLAQTPQVLNRAALTTALAHAARTGFVATDDVGLLEHAGLPVRVVPSTAANLKITTPADWTLAEAIAAGEDPPSP
jgi:2-C-methyl-D-erythritol 4-phosphate cytidylyltransferase